MSIKDLKPRKISLVAFNEKYANNPEACYQFFFDAKYPDGWVCEKCGSTSFHKFANSNTCVCTECGHKQYLFAGTVFQDNKLDLYKLLLGIYLFFTSNKGISAVEMHNTLGVNIKTAQLLLRKCRILMNQSETGKKLDSMFYEADTAYIGSASKEPGHQGKGTQQQPFLALLSTEKDNSIPRYIRLIPILKDNSETMERLITENAELSEERTLNADGTNTLNRLKSRIRVVAQKVDYEDKGHRLHWINVMIGNIKNHITGIYHGVAKRDLPLFLTEQEYRFNHRFSGETILEKVQKYINQSHPASRRAISAALDQAMPLFIAPSV